MAIFRHLSTPFNGRPIERRDVNSTRILARHLGMGRVGVAIDLKRLTVGEVQQPAPRSHSISRFCISGACYCYSCYSCYCSCLFPWLSSRNSSSKVPGALSDHVGKGHDQGASSVVTVRPGLNGVNPCVFTLHSPSWPDSHCNEPMTCLRPSQRRAVTRKPVH